MNVTPQSISQFTRRHGAGLGRLIGLICVVGFFSMLDKEGRFLTGDNFLTVINQAVIVTITALGATCIIISAGIDLSVGSVISLTSVVTALALVNGWHPVPAAMAGVATGGICGLLNGTVITAMRIVPFIATLGMMGVARGVALLLGKGSPVRPPMTWLDDLASSEPLFERVQPLLEHLGPLRPLLKKLGLMGAAWPAPDGWIDYVDGYWIMYVLTNLSLGVWLVIGLAVVVAVMLRFTVFGRHIYAVGSNEATARLCGLPVGIRKVQIYVLAGVLSGVAGVMQFSRLTQGDPTVAQGLELDVIAAVVIGGGSLTGGEGGVAGTLIGALIIFFLRNGCNMLGLDNFVQQILIGLIIIAAVYVDQLRQKFGE